MNWYHLHKHAQSQKEPWQMTQKEFMQHHYTGQIPSHAYRNYATRKGIDWVKIQNYPQLVNTIIIDNKPIEIRRNNEKKGYTATDENGDIIRDEKGMAKSLTPEQIKAKGYAEEDGGLAAFDNGEAVGFASNEWGSAGVWVVEEMQRKGLGTYLLKLLMQEHTNIKHIGQMTNAGWNMSTSYHKQLVQDAIQNGKPVPDHVKQDVLQPKNPEI